MGALWALNDADLGPNQTSSSADRRVSRRLPHLGLIALANSNLAMDFVPHTEGISMCRIDDRCRIDVPHEHAPTDVVYDVAWDLLEIQIWGGHIVLPKES